jgi:hypothetical protein
LHIKFQNIYLKTFKMPTTTEWINDNYLE